jgi:hypothetical protein
VSAVHAILPFAEIESRFDKPVILEQLGMDAFAQVARRDPNGLASMAFTVWQRYLRANPAVGAGAVRDYIRLHGGNFWEGVEAVIGAPVVHDLSYSRCTIDDPALEEPLAAYLFVARVYPNDVHVADMSFANPYLPIPPERRRFKFQRFKGLSLLGTLLARAEAHAAEQGCDYLTLNAATDDLVPLFTKYGFVVEDGQATSLAMEKRVGSRLQRPPAFTAVKRGYS